MCNSAPAFSESDPQWLGLDPGTVRCGLAVADASATLAFPLAVVPTEPRTTLARRLAAAAGARKLKGLVVGLPLNQHGAEGPAAVWARTLGEALAADLGCAVQFIDERFTTAEVLAKREESGISGKRRREAVDAQAAAAILQAFLDRLAQPE